MKPQTQNLIASFTGAAIGLLIEHSTAFAVLYAGAGLAAGPWVLGKAKQMLGQQQPAPTAAQTGVPEYRL